MDIANPALFRDAGKKKKNNNNKKKNLCQEHKFSWHHRIN